MPYALDNGAWGCHLRGDDWAAAPWLNLLRWAALSGQRPLWAIVPDVVGNREQTLARWEEYSPIVKRFGFPPAFAAQDGMTVADVPGDAEVVFLGGSTEWKEAAIGPWCREVGRPVHVGRVNNSARLVKCFRAGASSVDGTGWRHTSPRSNQTAELVKFVRETREQN
jgi:hypothetical protein